MLDFKPCPFCGDINIRLGYYLETEMPYIECVGCGIEVKYSDCINSAIQIWNQRIELQKQN